jgi:transglutaminase-like putative cysteine protease
MTRRTRLALLVLIAWGSALAWLATRRALNPPERLLEKGAPRIGPGASFYAVTLADTQIGTAGLTTDTTASGLTLLEVLNLDLPGPGPTRERHSLRSEAEVSRAFRLERFNATLNEGGALLRIEVFAAPGAGLLIAAGRSAGEVLPVASVPDPRPGLASAVPFQFSAAGRLTRNRQLGTRDLDPLTGTITAGLARTTAETTFVVADSAVRDSVSELWTVAGWDTVRAWRIERTRTGHSVREWVDDGGRPVRTEFAFGVRIDRTAFEMATSDWQARVRTGRLSVPAVVSGARPFDPGKGTGRFTQPELTVVVGRTDGPAWPDATLVFAGGRQRVSGDTVTIGRGGSGDAGAALRYRNNDGLSAADLGVLGEALGRALRGDQATGDTVTRLARWVARDLLWDNGPLAPATAVQAARAGRAGTEGKAHLLAALARAAGFPARVVSGVVVTREGLPAHSWVEVWRNGDWVAADPVTGLVPAPTDFLRVTEGPARPLVLVPLIGALKTTMISPNPTDRRRP